MAASVALGPGPRLFYLGCVMKDTVDTKGCNTVNLYWAPKCIGTLITYRREDLEGVPEPNHRLVRVKARTSLLTVPDTHLRPYDPYLYNHLKCMQGVRKRAKT